MKISTRICAAFMHCVSRRGRYLACELITPVLGAEIFAFRAEKHARTSAFAAAGMSDWRG